MKVKVYNLEGKETGEMNLLDSVFGVKIKPEVVHEVFVALQNNQREPWADTKSKGEVRGGGKKPWQQKGTGRARHGSIRSPIWKGGGVTFGPTKERNFKKKINKKMARKALLMAISSKAKNRQLLVLDEIKLNQAKTKEMALILKNFSKLFE